MKDSTFRALTAAVLILLCAAATPAQDMMEEMPSGVRGSYLKLSMKAEEQILALLESVPEDAFMWRPMEGVRSMSESFLHPAAGNYIILKTIGGMVPEGVDLMKLEKSTSDKKQIKMEIQRSFEALRGRVGKLAEVEVSQEVDFFGSKMTVGDMLVFAVAHQRESLGQEIAYARMNKVVPPWTAERIKKTEEKRN